MPYATNSFSVIKRAFLQQSYNKPLKSSYNYDII